jgi:hypothetical protein
MVTDPASPTGIEQLGPYCLQVIWYSKYQKSLYSGIMGFMLTTGESKLFMGENCRLLSLPFIVQ